MAGANLLIIGSSTGGPKILEELIPKLTIRGAILIVQHITPSIDRAFVASLARVSPMPVTLAADGDLLQPGQVHVAPGGTHLLLAQNHRVQLRGGERVNSVIPSIDVTMKSLVRPAGLLAGVILTGMGRDGAEGIMHMKQIGATTMAQDRSTSVIFGMPQAAAETGCVDFVLPTGGIAQKIQNLFK